MVKECVGKLVKGIEEMVRRAGGAGRKGISVCFGELGEYIYGGNG